MSKIQLRDHGGTLKTGVVELVEETATHYKCRLPGGHEFDADKSRFEAIDVVEPVIVLIETTSGDVAIQRPELQP